MEILRTVFIVCAALYALFYLFFAVKTGKPFKTILINALLGIVAFVIVNLLNGYTGVGLPANMWSLLCSVSAGVPGVALMIFMRILWLI